MFCQNCEYFDQNMCVFLSRFDQHLGKIVDSFLIKLWYFLSSLTQILQKIVKDTPSNQQQTMLSSSRKGTCHILVARSSFKLPKFTKKQRLDFFSQAAVDDEKKSTFCKCFCCSQNGFIRDSKVLSATHLDRGCCTKQLATDQGTKTQYNIIPLFFKIFRKSI